MQNFTLDPGKSIVLATEGVPTLCTQRKKVGHIRDVTLPEILIFLSTGKARAYPCTHVHSHGVRGMGPVTEMRGILCTLFLFCHICHFHRQHTGEHL